MANPPVAARAPSVLQTRRRDDESRVPSAAASLQARARQVLQSGRAPAQLSLDDSFARIDEGELFLYNMHVTPYAQGGIYNVEPTRIRKLLMHRHEIERLIGLFSQKRVTLVPLRLYQKHGLVKVALALGKGKRVFEKRDRIKERETDRELQRAVNVLSPLPARAFAPSEFNPG